MSNLKEGIGVLLHSAFASTCLFSCVELQSVIIHALQHLLGVSRCVLLFKSNPNAPSSSKELPLQGILERWLDKNLVDPASSHMLVSKIKPCMSQYKPLHGETANGSLKQL